MTTILETFESATPVISRTSNWVRNAGGAYAGSYSLKSSIVGVAGGTTTETFTFTVPTGATGRSLELWYKLESESGYDKLNIKLNNQPMVADVSGIIAWTKVTSGGLTSVNEGTNTLTVTYSKDGSVDTGADSAFIDNIQISYTDPITNISKSDTLKPIIVEASFKTIGIYRSDVLKINTPESDIVSIQGPYANDMASFSNLSQLLDNTLNGSYKWFTLADNRLDGTFKLVDTSGTQQVGWWGTTKADIAGVFTGTLPKVTIQKPDGSSFLVPSLHVSGWAPTGDYPKDFTVKVYNGAALLHTENVFDNTSVYWEKNLSQTYTATKIEVEISRVNRSYQVVKVSEAFALNKMVRTDSVKPKLAESKTLTASFTKSDNLKPKIIDTKSALTVSKISTDVISTTVVSSKISAGISENSTDNALVSITDTSVSLIKNNSLVRSDTELIKVSDSTTSIKVTDTSGDVVKPTLVDSKVSIIVTEITQDAGALVLLEAKSITVTDITSDTLKPKLVESKSIAVSASGADTLGLSITESSSIVVSMAKSDNIKSKIVEGAPKVTNTFSTSEILTPKVVDATISEIVSFTKADTLKPNIAEADNITVKRYSGDTLSVNASDSSFMLQRGVQSADVLRPKLVDSSIPARVSFARSDILTPVTLDVVRAETISFNKADNLLIKMSESKSIKVTSVKTDSLKVKTSDLVSGPLTAASDTHPLADATQATDGVVDLSYKWLTLEGNTLDGSYHPVDSTGASQIGWWSNQVSDATGTFATPPLLIAHRGITALPISVLRIAGDTKRNEFPVDFDIVLYGADATVLFTGQIRDNMDALWTRQLDDSITAYKVILRIYSVNKPNTRAKITEMGAVDIVISSDTLSPKLFEYSTETVSFSSADTLLPKAVDVTLSETVKFTKSDTLKPKVIDLTVTETVTLGSSDNLKVTTADASGTETVLMTRSDSLSVAEAYFSQPVYATFTRSDTLQTKLDEVRDVKASFTKTDNVKVKFNEVTVENVAFGKSDITKITLAENSAVTVVSSSSDTVTVSPNLIDNADVISSMTKSDSVLVNATDTRLAHTVKEYASDVLKPKVVETSLKNVTAVTTDNLKVKILDSVSNTVVTLVRTDSLTIITAESVRPYISFTKADDIKIKDSTTTFSVATILRSDAVNTKIADSSFFVKLEKWRGDTLKPKTVDTKTPVINTFTRSDILKPKTFETRKVTNIFTRYDAGSLVPNADFDVMLAHGARDTLSMILEEVTRMTNVHTRMDESMRRVYGKVEITYTDPFLDETIQADATSTARGTSAAQVANNVVDTKYKWFSIPSNKLDGTFHPMPSVPEYDVSTGWWSGVKADANGNFATPPKLWVTFEPRGIFDLKVVGDNIVNEYPVDFVIKLYNISNAVLHTETVTGNTLVTWTKVLPAPVPEVAKMEIAISKINKPNVSAKVLEFYTAIKQTYDDETLVGINLLEEQVYTDPTIPIGNVSANEIEIRLNNVDRLFDSMNPNSPLRNMLRKNRRIRAWLGTEVIQGEVEWHPLGTFWSLDWNAPYSRTEAEVIGRDRLEMLRLTDYDISKVEADVSLYDLAISVLTHAGLGSQDYIVDTALQSKIVPYAWFGKIPHREALAKIAAAAMGRCYCDRDGKVVLEAYNPSPAVTYKFTNDKSIYEANHPVAWGEMANEVEVEYTPRTVGPTEELYNSTYNIPLAPGEIIVQTLVIDSDPVYSCEPPVVIATGAVTVTAYEHFAWGIKVTIRNDAGVANTITNITVQGTKLIPEGAYLVSVEDALSIRDNGRQKFSVKQAFIQTRELATSIASALLDTYKTPRQDVVLNARGNIGLRLGQRVTVPGFQDLYEDDYLVIRQDIRWEGYLEATIEGKKIGG